MFQSLTRDSNHSNFTPDKDAAAAAEFQSLTRDSNHSNCAMRRTSLASWRFQSLTRDSNHSNNRNNQLCQRLVGFNPSRGIAIIQTPSSAHAWIALGERFQSLTRDSNHSNLERVVELAAGHARFNPSRGIAIIQTALLTALGVLARVSIPHAG